MTMVLTADGPKAYNAFELALRDAVQETVCRMQADGTARCSRDCLAQNIATGQLTHLDGAPRGSNAQWMFGKMLENVICDSRTFKRFVRG